MSHSAEMLASRIARRFLSSSRWREIQRSISASAIVLEKPLPPRRVVSEDEITESFLKGTGPGGQKINKTSSAVQLKHLPTGIVVKCQGTRSREQNRKDARRLLGEKLEDIEKGDQSRTAIKAERARTKKTSADKKSKRKYRKLEDEKRASEAGSNEAADASNETDPSTDFANGKVKVESESDRKG